MNTKYNLLIVGQTYKYKELCSILEEDRKTSDSKNAQLKRWRRFFDWENPTTHTYKIIEIYDEPKDIDDGRKNNGGVRVGSGAKKKLQEEFDYLFNAFLHREFNRNVFNGQADICESHFFNGDISKYFGLYGDMFYKAREDFSDILTTQHISQDAFISKTNEFSRAWSDINKKIAEKRKSWIYNKIDKMDGVNLDNGIIAYIDGSDKSKYMDELVDRWNLYMKEYIRMKGLRTEADVAEAGLWKDAVNHISKKFDGYDRVERTKKITFDVELLRDYDWEEYETYRHRMNNQLVCDLHRYFKKKMSVEDLGMYRYVIDKYVAL